MTKTATKIRLPRTSTLVLIAVVLLIGGGALMVWLPYHREQTAIAEVERLGGKAYSEIVRPGWVSDAVDVDYLAVFERVGAIDLSGTRLNDAGLEHLRGLTTLKSLRLDETQITDAGLKHLRGLTNLLWLQLNYTPISDAGLEHIQGLTSLETLLILDTKVTDAGLEHLKGLTNLKTLYLGSIRVTKAGIEKLQKNLPDCEILWTPPAE